jgi:hypothetical protein
MDILCQTLINNNIPFNLKQKKDNIIIIPNGVIKLKNYQTIRNNTDIMDFAKQLTNLSSHYNMPIYAFNYNLNDNFPEFCNIINSMIDINRILVCHSLEQIIVGEYCYEIRSTGAIWTITTLFDIFYPIIKDKLIITTLETYKRAIVIMNDMEVELFHKYNINIIDNNMQSINMQSINMQSINMQSINMQSIIITQDTFRERELFTFKIDYVPLNGGNRSPCRVVDGITTICPNCNNIIYYNNLDGTIRKHSNCIWVMDS